MFDNVVGRLLRFISRSYGVPGRHSPRVLLLTGYDCSYSEIARLTVPRMEQYAAIHGYELQVVPEVVCDRHPAWIKIPLIRRALTQDVDFVFWIDVDALMVRFDVSILLAAKSAADLYMVWLGPETTRWQAPPGLMAHFNDGVMLIRVNDWSRDFFAQVWEVGRVPIHWRDQGAILHLLGYDNLIGWGSENVNSHHRRHVARLDPLWNSVPGVAMAEDPVVHHYAGIGNRSLKLELMSWGADTVGMQAVERRARSREISLQVRRALDAESALPSA